MQEVAEQNIQKANYAKKEIAKLDGFEITFSTPTFNEFVVRAPKNAEETLAKLLKENDIIGGLALSKYYPNRESEFLVCVTETNTKVQIDGLVEGLKNI